MFDLRGETVFLFGTPLP